MPVVTSALTSKTYVPVFGYCLLVVLKDNVPEEVTQEQVSVPLHGGSGQGILLVRMPPPPPMLKYCLPSIPSAAAGAAASNRARAMQGCADSKPANAWVA